MWGKIVARAFLKLILFSKRVIFQNRSKAHPRPNVSNQGHLYWQPVAQAIKLSWFNVEWYTLEMFVFNCMYYWQSLKNFKSSSNVLIWIENCWLPTRERNYYRNVFSSWKWRNTPRFRTLLFGKETVKTYFYKCSNSGIYESTPQPINGNKVVDK